MTLNALSGTMWWTTPLLIKSENNNVLADTININLYNNKKYKDIINKKVCSFGFNGKKMEIMVDDYE